LSKSISKPYKIFLACLLVGAPFLSIFLLNRHTSLFTIVSEETTLRDTICTEAQKPTILYGMVVDDLQVIEASVKRNQRFFDLFDQLHLSDQIFKQLHELPKATFDFRKVGANKKYTLIHEKDSLKTVRALIYEPSPIDYVIFYLRDSLQVEVCQREVVTLEKTISGSIEASLYETIKQCEAIKEFDISHELTNKFVDIFGWQVDFQRLQIGDRFKLIYEENLVDGKPISIGKILGIYFEHFNKVYYAIPFDQGEGADYFDENGHSLRKMLLKYPIEFTRISSRYNLNRFHPVAKVFRAHLGTDFAAPTGTPIRSVGDGIVQEARYTSNNGNYVKIRHNSTYTTAYLHMSRIAAHIVSGTRVRQGQTIGYVGSTGLATGPHLCYRFWRNGSQIDALRVQLPPSQPIGIMHLESFEKAKDLCVNKLNQISFSPRKEELIVAGN
jgi:murein DD-endopeptidase MepM/ murein hydrolase activator NlpD